MLKEILLAPIGAVVFISWWLWNVFVDGGDCGSGYRWQSHSTGTKMAIVEFALIVYLVCR